MLYVLSTSQEAWRGEAVPATLVTPIRASDLSDWWARWMGLDALEPAPELTLTVPSDAPLPDNLFALTVLFLYSERLIRLLRSVDIRFQSFPVRLVDKGTGAPIRQTYHAFRLLETMNCIDYDQSIIGQGRTPDIDKLVLKAECYDANRPMFRLERFFLTIINPNLQTILEAEHMTGFKYVPLAEYRKGLKWIHKGQ